MKYIAALDSVLEVSLRGPADLAFWTDRLRPEGLFPTPSAGDGRAQVWISGASSRFRGIRFCELSISVSVSRHADSAASDGIYLVQAFNSSRLFTFFERYWFQTPYAHAAVEVATSPNRAGALAGAGRLQVTLGQRDAAAPRAEPEVWEGPIFLPSVGRASKPGRRMFFARLAGDTITIPFESGRDQLQISPAAPYAALQWLLGSSFEPRTWSIRPHAQHARSTTVHESDAIIDRVGPPFSPP